MCVDSEMVWPIHLHNDLVIFNEDISREQTIICDALDVVGDSKAAHDL